MSLRVYVVRHGETDFNKAEIFRGRMDVELNQRGLKQAELVAERLAGRGVGHIYSSPMKRAYQTASVIAQRLGLKVVSDEGFIDLDFGEWEGLSVQRVKEMYPEVFEKWVHSPAEARIPGGEALEQAMERSVKRLKEIVEEVGANGKKQDIVIVTHRVITKLLTGYFLGLGPKNFWTIRQDTACINTILFDKGQAFVEVVNDTCHLRA